MKKPVLVIWLLLIFLTNMHRLTAQQIKFVPMDENLTQILKFHAVDTVIVVYPDDYTFTKTDSAFVESYVFWEQFQKKPVYVRKKEYQMTKNDLKKNIQFYGPFAGFNQTETMQVPVQKTSAGFIFKNELFNQPNDAFFYVNDEATRFYTCRNSPEASFPLRELPLGFYPFNILRNGEFVFNGFVSDKTGETHLNDVIALRSEYFLKPLKTRYFEIYATQTFSNDSMLAVIVKNIDSFVDSLCRFLNTCADLVPVTKIYFYENREDLQHFLAQSLHQTIHGKSLPGSNHITGLNMATLQHETGHTVIDFTIGKNGNSFWHEGFRQFTEYFFSEEAFKNDMQKTKENLELLTADLIEGKSSFFSNWANYPLSGAFFKFLVDKFGLEPLKQAYNKNQIETLLSTEQTSIQKLLSEFQQQLASDDSFMNNAK